MGGISRRAEPGSAQSIAEDLKLARQGRGLRFAPDTAFAGTAARPRLLRVKPDDRIEHARQILLEIAETYCSGVERSAETSNGPATGALAVRAMLLGHAPRTTSLAAARASIDPNESYVRHWETEAITAIARTAYEGTGRDRVHPSAPTEHRALVEIGPLLEAVSWLLPSIEPAIRAAQNETAWNEPHPDTIPYLVALARTASCATDLAIRASADPDIPNWFVSHVWQDVLHLDRGQVVELRSSFDLAVLGNPHPGRGASAGGWDVGLDTVAAGMVEILRESQRALKMPAIEHWKSRIKASHRSSSCDFYEPPHSDLCQMHQQYVGCERLLETYARIRRTETTMTALVAQQ